MAPWVLFANSCFTVRNMEFISPNAGRIKNNVKWFKGKATRTPTKSYKWGFDIPNHYNCKIDLSGLAHWNKKVSSLYIMKYNTYQGNPKHNIFIDEAVEILIQKQKCWAYEGCVVQMHFTFSHVCHLGRKENQWRGHFRVGAIVSYTENRDCARISSLKNSLATCLDFPKLKTWQHEVCVRATHQRALPSTRPPTTLLTRSLIWVSRDGDWRKQMSKLSTWHCGDRGELRWLKKLLVISLLLHRRYQQLPDWCQEILIGGRQTLELLRTLGNENYGPKTRIRWKLKTNKDVRAYHKLIGDFSRYKTKCQYIKTGMLFKKLDCGLLVDHHS